MGATTENAAFGKAGWRDIVPIMVNHPVWMIVGSMLSSVLWGALWLGAPVAALGYLLLAGFRRLAGVPGMWIAAAVALALPVFLILWPLIFYAAVFGPALAQGALTVPDNGDFYKGVASLGFGAGGLLVVAGMLYANWAGQLLKLAERKAG